MCSRARFAFSQSAVDLQNYVPHTPRGQVAEKQHAFWLVSEREGDLHLATPD
jgi:hypothetical protein